MRNKYKKYLVFVNDELVPGFKAAQAITGIQEITLRRRFYRSKETSLITTYNGFTIKIINYVA